MNHHPLAHFTSDWVSGKVPKWLEYFKDLPGTPCQILEIGSYEGRSACWFLHNLMDNPDSTLFCIDPWSGTAGSDRLRLFDQNVMLTGRSNQSNRIRAKFMEVQHRFNNNQFDLIYVDGDHCAPAVMGNAAVGWEKLKVGGLMLFDDYLLPADKLHESQIGKLPPGPAIDAFINLWGTSVEVIHQDWQLLVKKIRP